MQKLFYGFLCNSILIDILTNNKKKGHINSVPQLSLSHIKQTYCKEGALHNESLNLFWLVVTSTDKVTLLGVKTNTKSPTF